MFLGAILILSACILFFRNRMEAKEAEQAANVVLVEMMNHFTVPTQLSESSVPSISEPDGDFPVETIPPNYPDPFDPEMTVVEINGFGYIGYLSIPDLNIMLPIMSQWDYDRLQIAPCRYKGSTKTDDLILCAHNYSSHFGDIASLRIGSELSFTDMEGVVTYYTVAEITILQPTAIEEMESGEYPLTLFTCTYGGQSRITVRCTETSK